MKAKYKITGETVDVEPVGTWNGSVALYEAQDGRRFPMYALEFEKDIDWEQRRYEIAKDMMAAFLSKDCTDVYSGTGVKLQQAKEAVMYADALIAELKKGNEHETGTDH